MDDFLFNHLIRPLHNVSAHWISLLHVVLLSGLLLGSLRLFGKNGVRIFLVMAFLAANIQVLHQADFTFLSEPVALGTILFAFTYLGSDMLTEHFGAKAARQTVFLSILAQVTFAFMMTTTLSHPPLNSENAKMYESIKTLFLPTPRLILASLLSYGLSQLLDIWIFQKIRNWTGSSMLWLRFTGSTLVSGFIDNIIFSTLAWVVLSPDPVSFNTLVFTYILGTYVGRAFVSLISTPVMYLSYFCLPKGEKTFLSM